MEPPVTMSAAPAKAQEGPRDVAGPQAVAAEESGSQEDDQQRPEVVEEIRLDHRREAERAEQHKVIAEDPANAHQQGDEGNLPSRGAARAPGGPRW